VELGGRRPPSGIERGRTKGRGAVQLELADLACRKTKTSECAILYRDTEI
jgi:hypothetical protein